MKTTHLWILTKLKLSHFRNLKKCLLFLILFYFILFIFLWKTVKEPLPLVFVVTFVSGVQIINTPRVWYSHNILPMKNNNRNNSIWGLDNRFGCHDQFFLGSHHGETDGILRMLTVLLSGKQTILRSGTKTMNKSTTKIKDHSVEKRLEKI